MPQVNGYMNIYRSGYYHTPGKPGAFDRHAGDFYATEEAALLAAEPHAGYICTVPVSWEEDSVPLVNPFTYPWQEAA